MKPTKPAKKRRLSKYSAMLLILVLFAAWAAAHEVLAADTTWKETFEEVCGKVQSADSLSEKEIASLIEKADRITPEIQKSDDPGKKVYLTRLKRCRGVFEFMLDTKKTSK